MNLLRTLIIRLFTFLSSVFKLINLKESRQFSIVAHAMSKYDDIHRAFRLAYFQFRACDSINSTARVTPSSLLID